MVWRGRKDLNVELDDERTSKINAAGIINITIENLWRDTYSAMATGNMVLWNRKLDAIWAILGGDVKKDETEDKDMGKINLKIYHTGSLDHRKTGFQVHGENEAQIMSLQYLLLKEKSLFLRRLQNKQGKGTAYISEDTDDMD